VAGKEIRGKAETLVVACPLEGLVMLFKQIQNKNLAYNAEKHDI
jgi:hypothetical protein